MKRLTIQAPRRMSVELPGGGYYTAPWTEEAVREYKEIGGWFLPDYHDFDNRQTAKVAVCDLDEE